ncbi:PAS domain-containing protein [Nakamurella sp. YIM 132087]|uniref:histidine kinase n=1 Tax=Nakamurella alba TaxID=2665158 RepID=A0A7K1FI92_9ACTN|nr:histidine kinase N-terminal domain-containing protein [Nakamurella alba]MTD12993.1 PAS domain-containing protein [Nakamurella alba]
MSTLSDLLAEHTALPGATVAHLQRLVSEWQLLADMSFSDLLLWVPEERAEPQTDGSGTGAGTSWVCVAQVRPTTGTTVHPDDLVADVMTGEDAFTLEESRSSGRTITEVQGIDPPRIHFEAGRARTYHREVRPVLFGDEVVAMLSRDTGSLVGREASLLETAYIDAADDLFQMVVDGSFPPKEQTGEMHTGPRAGDGLVRLDADGRVVYVSPNALSAYHRMNLTGSLVGADLAAVTRRLVADPFDAAELAARISGAVQGRPSLRMEVEVRAATVLFRALPLRPLNRPHGALVLVRDVTEVRRRDRALLSKDATIREIHHRVKNNLQTVAALLRLQSRRSREPAVRAALLESVRRVSSIALVHDTLSTSADDRVDLDQIVDRLVPMIVDIASAEIRARVRRIGSFGTLGADRATPLVMVLAEVVQNALEHGYRPTRQDGEVVIGVERSARQLDVRVVDDGVGLPVGFSLERASGLGLQIVRTLVDSELSGTITLRRRDDQPGTEVLIRVPLRSRH